MIEASENIDLVTFHRQQDLEASRRETQLARAMAARPQPPPALESTDPSTSTAASTLVADSAASLPPGGEAPNATSGPGLTRIVIAAALVVGLFIVWVIQKRSSRPQ